MDTEADHRTTLPGATGRRRRRTWLRLATAALLVAIGGMVGSTATLAALYWQATQAPLPTRRW